MACLRRSRRLRRIPVTPKCAGISWTKNPFPQIVRRFLDRLKTDVDFVFSNCKPVNAGVFYTKTAREHGNALFKRDEIYKIVNPQFAAGRSLHRQRPRFTVQLFKPRTAAKRGILFQSGPEQREAQEVFPVGAQMQRSAP